MAITSAIRRLDVSDAEDYRTIRLAALKGDPDAFGSTYEIEVVRPLDHFAERLANSIVFGAYAAGEIVGMAGFRQETGPKESHKGTLWGMYVSPEARRTGAASALVAAVLQHAEQFVEQVVLTATQGNDAAIALYRKFGFEPYGVEPRSLKGPSGYSDEVLMVRFLRTVA